MVISDYGQVLRQLLPEGLPWKGGMLKALLRGLGTELSRVEAKILQLLSEANPHEAVDLLPEWEEVCGLSGTGLSDAQRRAAIIGKIMGRGGLTKSYIFNIAFLMGYRIEITEVHPALAGQLSAGDGAYSEEAAFVFIVSVLNGDMSQEGLQFLIDLVNNSKPAHTVAYFDFIDSRARVGIVRVGERILESV